MNDLLKKVITIEFKLFVIFVIFINLINPGHGFWNMKFPGTKWCGRANMDANNSSKVNDSGFVLFKNADNCCKAHYFCNNTIEKGESKYGIKNETPMKIFDCQCESDFYKCLKGVDTFVSRSIGLAYFDTLSPSCIANQPPAQCLQYKKVMRSKKCVQYSFDEEASPVWQLMHNGIFATRLFN